MAGVEVAKPLGARVGDARGPKSKTRLRRDFEKAEPVSALHAWRHAPASCAGAATGTTSLSKKILAAVENSETSPRRVWLLSSLCKNFVSSLPARTAAEIRGWRASGTELQRKTAFLCFSRRAVDNHSNFVIETS